MSTRLELQAQGFSCLWGRILRRWFKGVEVISPGELISKNAQANAARRRPAAEEEETAVKGVGAAGQRRVQLQEEGQRVAAQRAGQLRGPRQPSLAQPRRPAAHLAGELLAAQPPRRRRLHEAQFNLPGAGICHGHKQQVAATAAESGNLC